MTALLYVGDRCVSVEILRETPRGYEVRLAEGEQPVKLKHWAHTLTQTNSLIVSRNAVSL